MGQSVVIRYKIILTAQKTKTATYHNLAGSRFIFLPTHALRIFARHGNTVVSRVGFDSFGMGEVDW